MKRPLIYSALLHFTVLILLLVGFYNPFERVQPKESPMMIEFVNIAELSAAPVLAPESIKEQELPQPPKPTPPPPAPEPTPPPPQPEPPQPAPQPQPEPEPVKPEPTPEPKPDNAVPIPDPKAKKKPKEKEKPKEEKKKQKAEITLDKKKKPSTKTDEKKDDKKKEKKKSSKPSKSLDDIMNEALNDQETDSEDAPSKGRGAPADTIGPILTASEIGALGQHFSKCWLIPAGLRDARNIVVKIDISFDRDGIINKAEIVEKGRVAQDSAYRTAAESARRAVLDPNCSQLPLPPEKLDKFKKEGLRFSFDPKAMF